MSVEGAQNNHDIAMSKTTSREASPTKLKLQNVTAVAAVDGSESPTQRSPNSPNSELGAILPGASTPWSRKAVLTLDGGGVLGYSSLIVLRQLMLEIEKVERHEGATSSADSPLLSGVLSQNESHRGKFLPCHYFDYIGGTSAGGIIAILLGRLRVSVEECMKSFDNLSPALDRIKSHESEQRISRQATFPPMKAFSESIQDRLLKATGTDTSKQEFMMDPLKCKTLALCEDGNARGKHPQPYMYRSYDIPDKPISVHDVLDAIIVRPETNNNKESYSNPTYEVFKEISTLQNQDKNAIGFLLSLGTSKTWTDTLWKLGLKGLFKSESQRHEIDKKVRKELSNSYVRIQVPHVQIGKRGFRLQQIEHGTMKYLKDEEVSQEIRDYARSLVKLRRSRAKTRSWENFALGVRYHCEIHGDTFPTRRQYLDHLTQAESCHQVGGLSQEELERLLDDGRELGADLS